MEQLEFELWAEERINPWQRVTRTYSMIDYMARQTMMYGNAECYVTHDVASLDMIVRYRV